MEEQRPIITTVTWQGVTIEVSYQADWLGMSQRSADWGIAHLELRVQEPQGAPLPMTTTGYRSHFLPPSEVTLAGGAAAYVLAWLDHAAQSDAWRSRASAPGQLSLF